MADSNTTAPATTNQTTEVQNATKTGEMTVKKHVDTTMGVNEKGEKNEKISDNTLFKFGVPIASAIGAYFIANKATHGNKLLSGVIAAGGALAGSKIFTELSDDAQHAFGQGNDSFGSKVGRFFSNVTHIGGQNEADIEETVKADNTGAEMSV